MNTPRLRGFPPKLFPVENRGFDISVGQCKIAKISQNSEIEVQKKDPPFEQRQFCGEWGKFVNVYEQTAEVVWKNWIFEDYKK